jgi:hypothetical protein
VHQSHRTICKLIAAPFLQIPIGLCFKDNLEISMTLFRPFSALVLGCLTLMAAGLVSDQFGAIPNDPHLQYSLHAMPSETQVISVVNTVNTAFDQQIFQCPRATEIMQLYAVSCFWDVKELIHNTDVLMSLMCATQKAKANFLYLRDDCDWDARLRPELRNSAQEILVVEHKIVYKMREGRYICLAKNGLLINTSSKALMQTVLLRLDAWWLPRVALPRNLKEWSYINQKAQYWGFRHFVPGAKNPLRDFTKDLAAQDALATGFVYNIDDEAKPTRLVYLSDSLLIERTITEILRPMQDTKSMSKFGVTFIDQHAAQISFDDRDGLDIAGIIAGSWLESSMP